MKDSASPETAQLPATDGLNVGSGEPGAGTPESSIVTGSVPLTIVFDGSPRSLVGVSGGAGAVVGVPVVWPVVV